MKKPLNMLENPVYPNIRAELPRFQSSGKHWTVGSEVLLNNHDATQLYENAILPVARDFNTTQYGVSSHRSYVNKAFRPPLVTMEDTMPLSRQPRAAIVPRINPSLANAQGNNLFSARNETTSGISKYLTDRVKDAYIRPTVFCPVTPGPADNSVLPDLQLKIPSLSQNSGTRTVKVENFEIMEMKPLDLNPLETATGHSGVGPSISATSGYKPTLTVNGETNINYIFNDNLPSHSATPGFYSSAAFDGDVNTAYQFENNIPSSSATAGQRSLVNADGSIADENMVLETKLNFGDVIINPSTGRDDSSSIVEFGDNWSDAHTETRLGYSYYVTPQSNVQSANNRTVLPYKNKKIERVGAYKIPNNTSSQFTPINVSLKDSSRVNKSTKKYSI